MKRQWTVEPVSKAALRFRVERTNAPLTEEQSQWIRDQKGKLSRAETRRMFFRKFGRDLSASSVKNRWKE